MLLKNKTDKIKKLISNNNVLTSIEERYCYAVDALNFADSKSLPACVVFPESIDDVQKIVKYADLHEIPIVPRGAGTNMVGACIGIEGCIVIDFSKMNKIIEINPVNMTAIVQPGVVMGDLKAAVEEFGLFFPPDPSNYKVSTIGGAIAQSSGGAMSFKYGTTKDYILSLKVVTADGELRTFGVKTTKDASGYHLAQLMIGSEGTLGLVVEAVLKLIPKPQTSNVIVSYFNKVVDSMSAVNGIFINNLYPAAIEFMDNNSIKTIEDYTHSHFKTCYECVLLIELDGDDRSIEYQTEKILSLLKQCGAAKIYIPSTKSDYERIWNARRSSFAASARLAPDVISDDIIVPRENLTEMITKCNEIAKNYNLKMCLVAHIGDGNLHPQFAIDSNNSDEFLRYKEAKSCIYETALSLGGTISAEHGIGIEKKSYLNKAVDGGSVEYMKLIKKAFDPKNILNPGKIF